MNITIRIGEEEIPLIIPEGCTQDQAVALEEVAQKLARYGHKYSYIVTREGRQKALQSTEILQDGDLIKIILLEIKQDL